MNYSVLIERVEESESMPGFDHAHVPTLSLTTHGAGIEGAIAAAKRQIKGQVYYQKELAVFW